MERKYLIELTETQLSLIADCVEDCHRFAAGQVDLWNTTSRLTYKREIGKKLQDMQHLVTPNLPNHASYDWAGNHCPNECQRKFIAQTYPIYREILHFLTVEAGHDNVYSSPTLTCEDGGEPIKINRI